MTAADAKVVFMPSGRRGTVPTGTTLLDAARRLGVDLDSVCNGRALCGRCMVVPAFGAFAKHEVTSGPGHLDAAGATERGYRGRRPLAEDARLACYTHVLGDVVIDVPAASQLHRPVVRKGLALDDLVIDPVVRCYLVDVPAPDLGADRSDLRRLLDALGEQWELTGLEARPAVIAALQPALARGDRTVTVSVHSGRSITAVWPGLVDTAYGVAVDVGSTTVAGHLCDLATGEVVASAGIMNPQIRFGEDLMSRVSYVMMHDDGAAELTASIRAGLRELVDELVAQLPQIERDRIVDFVLVGNPIMHHLVLGIDPTPLGTAPFTLATDEPVDAWADDIEVGLANARLHVLPCIAGHVGADTAAAVLQEGPHRGDAVMLLVDVGTNAEIVLGNRDWLFAASSPTGPAFEGAQLSCGQRATAGAIERVRIDRDTLEPRFKVIGVEAWSDAPRFPEDAASVGVTGVCGSGVIEVIAELFLAGVILRDGTIDGAGASRTPRIVADGRTFAYMLHSGSGGELRITQNDVRAIQLAKAALNAGVRLLMDHAAISSFDSVRLAGAFGNHIDPAYAIVLGLIPDCDPAIARNVGNAAGSGAVRALLSQAARNEIAAVARKIVKIETAIEPGFQTHFVRALGFPDSGDEPPRRSRRGEPTGVPMTDTDSTAPAEPRRGRTGGRAGRQATRLATHIEASTYLTRTLKPFEVVSDEGLEIIEHNADSILEEVGVIVRDYPDALDLFAAAGADIDGERVRFPRGMCRAIVQATAPEVYTQHARNPGHSVQIGGDATVFAPNYGSPFVHDLDAGRRYATLADFQNFVKLAYLSPNLHHSGGTVCEPVDVPVNKRHLDMVYAHLRYSDKPFMGSVTAGSRAADSLELARIGFGGDLQDRTVMTSLINASSPLVWDATMLAAAQVYAAGNQATIITPFILAGAMAPVTTAGVAAQTLAEALAGMTFVQLVRPGAPVVFGSFASSMSMQTGAPTFGTPEPSLVLYVVAQLARRLGVPFRSGGSLCASKLPDAQAAYESANTLQATVLGGVNFVLHAAGWLEGGLAVGYEKFVLDDDQLGMMATFVRGVDLSENGQALDAIRENGPGQHFLGTAHTLANFENAFYRSTTADNASYEQWLEEGGLDAAQRANAIWKQQLAAYEPPPIDDAVDEALRAFVDRRKSEMPDEIG